MKKKEKRMKKDGAMGREWQRVNSLFSQCVDEVERRMEESENLEGCWRSYLRGERGSPNSRSGMVAFRFAAPRLSIRLPYPPYPGVPRGERAA